MGDDIEYTTIHPDEQEGLVEHEDALDLPRLPVVSPDTSQAPQ